MGKRGDGLPTPLHPSLHGVLNAGSARLNLFWLQELRKYLAF
jgi:hypothetical protein